MIQVRTLKDDPTTAGLDPWLKAVGAKPSKILPIGGALPASLVLGGLGAAGGYFLLRPILKQLLQRLAKIPGFKTRAYQYITPISTIGGAALGAALPLAAGHITGNWLTKRSYDKLYRTDPTPKLTKLATLFTGMGGPGPQQVAQAGAQAGKHTGGEMTAEQMQGKALVPGMDPNKSMAPAGQGFLGPESLRSRGQHPEQLAEQQENEVAQRKQQMFELKQQQMQVDARTKQWLAQAKIRAEASKARMAGYKPYYEAMKARNEANAVNITNEENMRMARTSKLMELKEKQQELIDKRNERTLQSQLNRQNIVLQQRIKNQQMQQAAAMKTKQQQIQAQMQQQNMMQNAELNRQTALQDAQLSRQGKLMSMRQKAAILRQKALAAQRQSTVMAPQMQLGV